LRGADPAALRITHPMPEKNPRSAKRQTWNGLETRDGPELPGTLEQSRRLEALAHLSGEVAHDVNNALQVIRNAVEILRRRLPSAEADVAGVVDMLARNSDRAASLMLRLLAFSGRLPLAPRATDANQLIAKMADQLREAAGTGGVAVETALADGLWSISADADRLQSAMLSLANNGRDAMPRGGTIMIETRNVCIEKSAIADVNAVPAGEYVSITVRDNGTGMTPEVLAKIFDPYFTTKETGFGIGLGLSQVYGFMKQSNGHIDVTSSPGRGTSVTLFFPRMAIA
jgi:signal transduction histidine kinase